MKNLALRKLAVGLSLAVLNVCVLADGLRTAPLSVGMYRIEAEVAATDQERATGLMHRTKMAENAGMLFVFTESDMHCFWMKNTLLPLSIAFLDEKGQVISMADMSPRSERTHCPAQPARYALEMNQGWFRRHNVKPGTLVDGVVTPLSR